MKLQATKLSYNIVYGIAPFFRKQLLETIENSSHIVLSFYESLNKVVKKGQMDVNIRFWDSSRKDSNVVTRYFDWAFLGHATAELLLDSFLECTENLTLKNK